MSELLDLTGERFGRLVVVARDREKKRTAWICKCDCGKLKSVQSTHLRSGATTSCGCYQKEQASRANISHGYTGSSLYARWKAMRQRCQNPLDRKYKDYGARGITVCPSWDDFETFARWCAENGYEEALELDRIDNDKGYCPENCRWCRTVINNHNRRITASIEGVPLRDFAEAHRLDYKTVHYRYYRLKKSKKEVTTEDVLTYANQLPLSSESC